MRKSVFIIASYTLICLVLILLCGCQYNADSDISINKDFIEDNQKYNQSVDSTIQKVAPSISPTPSPSYTKMFIKLDQYGSKLNVRDKASINSNIIGKLEHGDSVNVISIQDGWASINYKGSAGYVNTDYLIQEEPPEQMPPINNISPDEVYIDVYKEKRSLELWSNKELIGEYKVGLGFNPIGHKEKEGDGKTPEGSYYVCVRNPNSKYYLSLGVSYPGIPDAERGLASNLITQSEYNKIVDAISTGGIPLWNTALGGQIMIHGSGGDSDWTEGCIAVDNDVMDILWEYCEVGTRINIYP